MKKLYWGTIFNVLTLIFLVTAVLAYTREDATNTIIAILLAILCQITKKELE